MYSKSLAALTGDSAVPLAQTLRSQLNILKNRVSRVPAAYHDMCDGMDEGQKIRFRSRSFFFFFGCTYVRITMDKFLVFFARERSGTG